jgi:hypothetical protein
MQDGGNLYIPAFPVTTILAKPAVDMVTHQDSMILEVAI